MSGQVRGGFFKSRIFAVFLSGFGEKSWKNVFTFHSVCAMIYAVEIGLRKFMRGSFSL